MRLVRILETGTIRSRLFGALVLLAVLPVLVLVVSLVLLGRMSGDVRRIEAAAGLRKSGFIVAAQLNGLIAHPDPAIRKIVVDELDRMEVGLAALESGSPALQVLPVHDHAARERIAEARELLHGYSGLARRVLDEAMTGEMTTERRAAASREVLDGAYGLLTVTQRLTQILGARSTAALRHLWLLQAAAVLVALAVLLLTLWAVHRYILQPVPPLLGALHDVRAGRYGVHVEVRGENELSEVARGFNAMSSDLETTHHALVMQQAEILEKNAALERANTLKSHFVANMSHELRTPLQGIIGYTKLLRSGVYGDVPEKMLEPLQGVDETSAALLRLIDDILDVAKIEAGKMDLHLGPFRIADVVREVGELLQPLAIGKGLELYVRADAAVPTVTSDRDKVRRILLNLAGNAIKFTRRGRVEIEVLAFQPPAPDGPRATFDVAVRDTGIGIAADNLDLIFDDFRQLDGSPTREYGGTGLGLAISRRLARHLGGDIAVESRVGKGSTFTLRLPLFVRVDAEPRAAAPAAPPAAPQTPGSALPRA